MESRDTPSTAIALSAAGTSLLRFDTTAPATIEFTVAITGLAAGEVVEGLAFRPVTGQLFAVADVGGTARIGTLNLSTGAFTQIGAAFSASGSEFGLTFDPVNDRLRLVSDAQVNLAINPNDASVTVATNLSLAGGVEAAAFDHNMVNASAATMFAIDTTTDTLVRIGSVNGSPLSADTGIVTVVGSLGVNATAAAGFTIMADGSAFATLTVNGVSSLYSIDLSTGAATQIGVIGSGSVTVGPLATAPISVSAVGTGAGISPSVRVYDSSGSVSRVEAPFSPTFTGGVSVATGDVNGDGVPDIIVGAGATGGPNVQVFDGRTGIMIHNFFAFDPNFTGGIWVAAADISGTGHADIIVGAGSGHTPEVRVFDGLTEQIVLDFMAYDTTFTGGVQVAAGNLELNGGGGITFKADIITGAGPTGGPHVKVFNSSGAAIRSFFAYDPTFTGGVFVAAADVNGDGRADIITGAGATGGPHVKVFSGLDNSLLASFMAFDPTFTGGVRVGGADISGDGRLDIEVGAGAGIGPQVRVFSSSDQHLITQFTAFDPAFMGGIFVGGSLGGTLV